MLCGCSITESIHAFFLVRHVDRIVCAREETLLAKVGGHRRDVVVVNLLVHLVLRAAQGISVVRLLMRLVDRDTP
jgi:hypothetical protein